MRSAWTLVYNTSVKGGTSRGEVPIHARYTPQSQAWSKLDSSAQSQPGRGPSPRREALPCPPSVSGSCMHACKTKLTAAAEASIRVDVDKDLDVKHSAHGWVIEHEDAAHKDHIRIVNHGGCFSACKQHGDRVHVTQPSWSQCQVPRTNSKFKTPMQPPCFAGSSPHVGRRLEA